MQQTTTNPALRSLQIETSGAPATYSGILNKTSLCLLNVVLIAVIAYRFIPAEKMMVPMIASGFAALALAFFVSFKRTVSPVLVILYSLIEGGFIGAISKVYNTLYNGIVFDAVLATFVVALVTLFVYRFTGLRVGPKFRKIVAIGTFSLLGVYLVNFVLSLAHVNTGIVETGSQAGILSIVVSVIAIGLATSNLILDFDYAQSAVQQRMSADQEWRVAFGLTVTLIWLYTELLRFLSYFRD